jgi:hypothetical protein
MASEAPADRALMLRFRIVAGLLAILCAFDAGQALQLNWAREDHAKLQRQRQEDLREIFDDVERQRSQVHELTQHAQQIIDDKLKAQTTEPAPPVK